MCFVDQKNINSNISKIDLGVNFSVVIMLQRIEACPFVQLILLLKKKLTLSQKSGLNSTTANGLHFIILVDAIFFSCLILLF